MKRKNVFILVISMVIFLGFANNVAAQIYRMDDSVYENMEYENLNLGFSKLDSYDINNNNITPVNDVGDLPLAFIIDYNNRNAVTYEANANDEKPYLLKLSYKNITSIGSRNVDVNIYITKIALSDYWGNGGYYSEDGATFAFVSEDAVWIGSEISSVPYRYSAHQEVEVTTEILWSDDHTVVDLPFLNIQSDIDINYNTLKNKTKEMWKAAEGYIGDFYIFNSSQLAQDENGAWYNTGDSTNGTDSYIKTGIYAPTENGRFSSVYHEGICASKIGISMQTFTTPSVSSSVIDSDSNAKDQVDAVDDKIVYSLLQKFGDLYVSIFTPYSSFDITDTIDSNLNFESAKVILNDGNETIDITNNSQYGELIYDSNTKTVRYKFNTTWLSNNDNYKGQNINMTITTSLNEVNRNFTNVANTYLDGISFPSNDVIDTYVKKSVVYRYVSGTNGKMLPSAISTSTGEYKIIDNNTYLVGEEVQRSNIVEIGTKYSVYENGVHVGDWILKNWSEDSITMKYDGTEFVGTWIYVAIDAKVSSSNPLTGDNIYIWFGMLILGLLPGVLIAIKLKKSEVR